MAGDEDEKKADEDKDLELDLMAEAELLRLTRQYRIMEGDKEAYKDEAQKILRYDHDDSFNFPIIAPNIISGMLCVTFMSSV